MCGITGHVKFNGPVDEKDIDRMNEAIRHRGPDGSGIYINTSRTAALGHRRLSLIDLSEAGHQPMNNGSDDLWITYNGEIYNYIELRAQLELLGYKFHSGTDTEVILHGYSHWGYDVLNRLKGMFAFGIWDNKKGELFLARDRFGIKPLYYYHNGNDFVFASEIKGIKANAFVRLNIDYTSVANFFVYRYVPGPKTIWCEVSKLPAACYLVLKKDNTTTISQYWKIPFGERIIDDKQAIQKFDDLLLNAVKTHARSDVPVGSFLSGGYDSSAIVYYMSRFGYVPDTFSIGFKGWETSEHHFAEVVANQYKTNHHTLILEEQSRDIMQKLAWVYDEPNGDISTIPTYYVSQQAAKYVKAVMSGEGSDEILVGYQWQKDYRVPAYSLAEKIKNIFSPVASPMISYYADAMGMGRFDEANLKQLLNADLHSYIPQDAIWWYKLLLEPGMHDLKAMQVLDIRHFMGEQVLAKMDRASMAHSLEVRLPFLDHEICEFVFGLNISVYYRPEETKHLLYQNIKTHLPAQILNRRKQGFVGPDQFYKQMDWYSSLLAESELVNDKIINAEYVHGLLVAEDYWRLWKIAVMEYWYRQWC
jgi:asparagine synthase (glutamine-hydrolysing)